MLPLSEVFRIGMCQVTSRNLKEGEAVLNTGQVTACGIQHNPNPDKWSIYALVLQTSGINSKPHNVTGLINKKDFTASDFKCMCKAGASECCKHVLAVLLHCNRNAIASVDTISSTDKACLWNKLKGKALSAYQPEPVRNFHCYKKPKMDIMATVNVDNKKHLQMCLSMLPCSAFAKHIVGRGTLKIEQEEPVFVLEKEIEHPNKTDLFQICSNANNGNRLMEKLNVFDVGDINACCRDFYVSNLVTYSSLALCVDTLVDKVAWQRERQFRITGSRCYHLFTYAKDDWATKAQKYFHMKNFASKETRHGVQFEPVARQAYAEYMSCSVIECGLIVNEQNPWLGVSPDGVAFSGGKPSRLIEIKCPYAGLNSSISEVLPICKFLSQNSSGQYFLKKKHAYYGQITLGMALNVKKCDFVIFCSKDGSMSIETIKLDKTFSMELLCTLKSKYFKNMIHNVCYN